MSSSASRIDTTSNSFSKLCTAVSKSIHGFVIISYLAVSAQVVKIFKCFHSLISSILSSVSIDISYDISTDHTFSLIKSTSFMDVVISVSQRQKINVSQLFVSFSTHLNGSSGFSIFHLKVTLHANLFMFINYSF